MLGSYKLGAIGSLASGWPTGIGTEVGIEEEQDDEKEEDEGDK
jgi:hypothetical protein